MELGLSLTLSCVSQERRLNEATVNAAFDEYEALMAKHRFRPQLMYNLDETMVGHVKGKLKLITRRDDPKPVLSVPERDPEHVTVVVTISAAGDHLDPLVIFPLATVPPLDDTLRQAVFLAGQPAGWMTSELFRNLIFNSLVPQFEAKRRLLGLPADEPVLLVFDGASTHVDLDLDTLAQKHHVYVFLLPVHSSTLMQPLDLTVYGILKQFLAAHFTPLEGESITDRRNRLLHCVLNGLSVSATGFYASEGWRKAGLHPISRKQVLDSPIVRPQTEAMPAPPRSKEDRRWLINGGRLIAPDRTVFHPPVSAAAGADSAPKEPRWALHSLNANTIRLKRVDRS
jgi:hypothetical protein